MARVNIFGRSGVGKSWFTGAVLEDILTPSEGRGRASCGCPAEACDHGPQDDAFIPEVETGDGAPDFDPGRDFEYAIHIDIEDEEPGFSDPNDPTLLTLEITPERLDTYVKYPAGQEPDWVPEEELQDGPEILLPKAAFYYNKYVRVVPNGLTDEELKVLVEMLADAAMKTGDCHFSLDEAHLVATKHNIGDKLMRLVTGGRKRGVEWVFVTQRPQKMHEDILSQSDYTVYFELRDRDRDKAAEKSEAIPDAEEKIESLGKRTAIIEDFDNGEWREFSTEDLDREIPHHSGDDGKADEAYESLIGSGES